MSEERIYACETCQGRKSIHDPDQVPECCGRPMMPLDQCRLASTAENSRFDEPDEPCDDGRAG